MLAMTHADHRQMVTTTAPRLDRVLGLSQNGFHRVAYADWGDPGCREACVCVHGLTRSGRDFDALAAALTPHRRVLCPDVAGRGRSDWLASAEAYSYQQHLADLTAVIARTGTSAVDWVGTSMGGILGMLMAAQPNTPIRRLVINDVGPFIPRDALLRIREHVGVDPRFPDFEAAEAYMRRVSAPFGDLPDHHWRHLTRHCVRRDGSGGYRLHYDPRIGEAFRDPDEITDVDLWHVWDAIACPVLVVRGAESDLLTAETVTEMTRRGPSAEVVTVPETGHAPPLLSAEQIRPVVDWLTARG